MDDIGEIFFGCLGALLLLAIAGLLLGLGCSAINDRRTFDVQAACLTKRMKPERQTFGTKVVCVPDATRRDTATIEVKQ